MNLADYRHQFAELPQIHYVGIKDKVIPSVLVEQFVGNEDLIIKVKNASHNSGWEEIYQKVWFEK